MSTQGRSPKTPYIPESDRLHGPGVEFWRQQEMNNDDRTDHDGLIEDESRRRRILERLKKNAEERLGSKSK